MKHKVTAARKVTKHQTARPDLEKKEHEQLTHDMNVFFSYCKNIHQVHDMIATIAAGGLLSAEALPIQLLPHALLLHAVAPEPGVVDDVVRLVERMVEEFEQKDHGIRWWHPQGFVIGQLIYGQMDPAQLNELPDTAYIVRMYGGMSNGLWKRIWGGIKR